MENFNYPSVKYGKSRALTGVLDGYGAGTVQSGKAERVCRRKGGRLRVILGVLNATSMAGIGCGDDAPMGRSILSGCRTLWGKKILKGCNEARTRRLR